MNELAMLQNYLLIGAALIALGLTGFLVRRNLIVMFLSAEMMLQGVSLSLIAWGRFHSNWSGQLLVIFIITVAACEAAVALVLVLMLCRASGSLDAVAWQRVREEGVKPYVDSQLPEEPAETEHWPTLAPAGREPKTEPQEHWYRTHV